MNSVTFWEPVLVNETYSPDEYDRTASPVARLSYTDMLELMHIKIEMRSYMTDCLMSPVPTKDSKGRKDSGCDISERPEDITIA
ncbi:hypothetical protein HDV02_002699 [Globomyces sp. JEL0801]|nr:hypothetical protein HDV02_002699 [Globomyces sp. JEL0801]